MNGKGEIKDVSLNCEFLNNEVLKKLTPFVQLQSVHVSKLSFHVTAWSNLKKAPIVVDIEDVTAVIVEPLDFLDRSQRKVPRQISQQELNDLISEGLHKLRGAYGLFDRIIDNIQVEMRSLHVSFQPRGKFKTERVGLWTPPTILVDLRHIKYASVDEYGQEGTPEQVWSHNKHQPGIAPPYRAIMIYKKLSLQATIGLAHAESGEELPSLIRDAQLEVHVAFRKRLRDSAVLAIQVDVTAHKVAVHVPTETVPMLAHAMAGIQYCLTKDRAFQDPLVKEQDDTGETSLEEAAVVTTNEDELIGEGEEDDDDDDEKMASVDVSDSGSESDHDEASQSSSTAAPPAKQSSSVSARSQSAYLRRPVIVLPNGLVIHERLSFSLSVHQITIRGIYSDEDDGYIQLVTKGLVAEAMWPKDSGEKGGYVQASLSFISLQERYRERIRSILLGGVQHNTNKLPIGLPGIPRPEKGSDSSFPLFEDRSIRPDPFGLRHTFPEQAFGIKMTVEYIEKVSNPCEENIMVLHEIGIDRFDVLADSDAWCRALRFAMNESCGGFDPRWHTGDWSDELSTDMLVAPTQTLNLEEYLQSKKEILLDENLMISSDLMNVTARIMNVEIRIPAAIQKDVRSCDICMTVSETMLVVSSALPRTFLTGKIGSSVHGEGSESKGRIVFPNDPSDLCYALEATEDPSMRQRGEVTDKNISTARCQLTIRGFDIRVVPVIPFCNASQPQRMMEPTEMTLIVCFEGEPPTTPESNLVKIVLFFSFQFHRLALNCDLDVISGALSTIIHHSDVVHETASAIEGLQNSKSAIKTDEQGDCSKVMKHRLKNRRVLVRRQIARSREAGGLSVSACMQLAEFSFTFWRQNVPLTSRFRASLSNDANVRVDEAPIALMKLMHFEMKGMEIGAEWSILQTSNRRIVVKGSLSEMKMGICDFEVECNKYLQTRIEREPKGDPVAAEEAPQDQLLDEENNLIELLTFGLHAHEHRSYAEVVWGHNDILLRVEEDLNSTRSISLACEVGPPGVAYLRVREIESLCLLLLEALLMPTGLRGGSGLEARTASDAQNVTKTDKVDGVVQASLIDILPERVSKIVAQITIVDILVFVPDQAVTLKPVQDIRWLGLVVHQTSLLGGYFSEDLPIDQHLVMDTLASTSAATWSSLFLSQERGIHLTVRARPSLYSAMRKDLMCITTECLVSEFEITCSYSPSDCSISMGDTTLSVKNLDDMHHLQRSLLDVKDQGYLSLRKLNAVFYALKREERSVVGREVMDERGDEYDSKGVSSHVVVIESSSEAEQSLRGLRQSLAKLREVSEAHAYEVKEVLKQQQQKIGFLRYEVFSRERDRIAALALVSSQISGWLKMGGTHEYGQRLTGVTTMWRYYVVLHKSLMILYSSPGQSKPMDIAFLDGAHLLPLAGGRRKRDAKWGFSIVESGGVARFFLAENGPDFELWIRSINKITKNSPDGGISVLEEEKNCNESFDGASDMNLSPQSKEISGSSRDASDRNGDHDHTPRRAQIRQKLGAVTSSTKSKLGSAAVGAKTRLGPAASSTKSRIGSAVQAARQKSASNTEDETESISTGDSSSIVATSDSGENSARPRSGRFAAVRAGTKNRLGSALQAAKEKGKAATEQRRRRLHDRDEHDYDFSPDPLTAVVESQSVLSSSPPQLRSRAAPLEEESVIAIPPVSEASTASVDRHNIDRHEIEEEERDTGVDSSFYMDSNESLYQSESSTEPAGSGRGQQLKSKLGAAVQSVRRSTAQDGSLRRRFGSSGKEGNDNANLLDASSAIKMRGIHVGNGNPVDALCFGRTTDVDIDLKAIKGYWVSSVDFCSIQDETRVPPSEEIGGTEASPGSVVAGHSQESSGDTNIEMGGVAANMPDRHICLEQGFRMRVVSGTEGGQVGVGLENERAVASEIVRSVSDVLALHTALSECVGRVILVATSEASIGQGENGGDTHRTYLPDQDMNALDSVRYAGRLLKGLLETGSDEFENPKTFNDYQCKYKGVLSPNVVSIYMNLDIQITHLLPIVLVLLLR